MYRQDIQKLRDLPIEEVAHRLGMRPERHKCLCPFHDDHHAAVRKLMRMINLCRPLMKKLESNGYTKMAKAFTSKEVEMIIEHIGEP